MNLSLDTIVLTAALAGSAAYMAYMIEKRREDIRKTIQVIELKDTGFWESLSQFRDLVPAKA